MNIYESCPVLQNARYRLRLVEQDDCEDLLKVYSDPQAVPLFNSDNCHGDDFCYTTKERMAKAIDFWLFSYEYRYFVRWSIIDISTGEAVGTIELFRRDSEDAFTDTALLRLDLRSDYEREDAIGELLSIITESACELFECASITTKAASLASVRRAALQRFGFQESSDVLRGDDGTEYRHYWVYRKMYK